MPVPTGSVHSHTLLVTNPSRAGVVVSRSELVEPGGRNVFLEAWLGRVSKAWDVLGITYHIRSITVFRVLEKKNAEGGLSQL